MTSYDDDGDYHTKIYPTIPSAPVDESQVYRLKQIEDVEQFLRNEIRDRNKLKKKFGFWNATLHYVDGGLIAAEVISAGAGIALISSGIGAPIGLALEGLAIFAGVVQLPLKRIAKKINFKSNKHSNIVNAAQTSLDQVALKISKAITDGVISQNEFELIIRERQRYLLEKEKIRSKTTKEIFDTKKIIEQAKKEEREKIAKKLSSAGSVNDT